MKNNWLVRTIDWTYRFRRMHKRGVGYLGHIILALFFAGLIVTALLAFAPRAHGL